MSFFDYTRGAMDAEFVGHMTGGGNLATLKAMRERMEQLSENAKAWKAHANQLAEQLKETERALAETQEELREENIEKRSTIARSNTILREADLCREIPAIKPVFSALGDDNRDERIRLGEIFEKEARQSDRRTIKDAGLNKEEILQYHKARSEGVEKPDINR